MSGLLSQIAMQMTTEVTSSNQRQRQNQRRARAARNEYLGARGAKIAIFPGSRLSKRPPSWIMAAELVETSRLWRSEEHTSELQSRGHLVCRLLLEKKKKIKQDNDKNSIK